jgi:hypothetical protein
VNIKQIKQDILSELSKRCGFELAHTTNIDHYYIMAIKMKRNTVEEVAIMIEKDCTLTYTV